MVFRQKILVTVVLILVLLVGCSPTKELPIENTGNAVAQIESSEGVKVLRIDGENFKFVMDGKDNPDITVKQGDKIRIEFQSRQGLHDWVVDELNARTEKVRAGSSSTIEFIADQKGTFEYYCSIGSHRANGMKGRIIVE